MGYEDIRLKLVGDSTILKKLSEMEELIRQMRSIISDLAGMGFIRIDSDVSGGVGVSTEGVDAEKE